MATRHDVIYFYIFAGCRKSPVSVNIYFFLQIQKYLHSVYRRSLATGCQSLANDLTSYYTLPHILPFVILHLTLPYLIFYLSLSYILPYLTWNLTLHFALPYFSPYILPFVTLPYLISYLTFCLTLPYLTS